MFGRKALIGAGIFIIVAIFAAAAAVVAIVLINADDDRSGGSTRRTANRSDLPPRSEAGPSGAISGQAGEEMRLVAIVPSPRIVRLDEPGDSQRLTVSGYYSDRSEADLERDALADVSYASSDPSVAQVDSRGVVTGVETGGADITVTYQDHTATVTVFVWGEMRTVPAFDSERLLETSDDGSAIILNRVMVELEPGREASDADEVAAQIGGSVLFAFRTFPGYLVEFDGRSEADLEQALAVLEDDPRVAIAYPDLVLVGHQGGGTNTIETLNLKHGFGDAYLDAGMEDAWNSMGLVDLLNPVTIGMIDMGFVAQTGDPEVDAVLASEFDYDRIDFRFGKGNWMDPGHGTGVASIMIAQNNENAVDPGSFSGVLTSVAGIEHNTVLYSAPNGFQHSGARFTSALEDIIRYKNQVDVVNISMGYRCTPRYFDHCVGEFSLPGSLFVGWRSRWKELMTAMPEVVFVIAADNDERDTEGMYPADFAPEVPNAITVGATYKGNRAWYSSFGTAITLGAPGSWVWVVNTTHGYRYEDGTSAAAPMVAGTVALLRALDPQLSATEIKEILVRTGGVHTVCTASRDEKLLDPCPPENQETWPILNAGEAVSAVLWPSVDAEIDVDRILPRTASIGSQVELTVPVTNTGGRDWTFDLAGSATLPSEKTIDLGTVQHVIPAGGTHPFKLGFTVDEVGDWELELEIHRNPERTSMPDSEQVTLRVVQSAGEEPMWQTISAGGFHSCAINSDLALVCWGSNHSDITTYTGQSDPPDGAFLSVSSGIFHNCAIRTDQLLVCWGDNSEGQSRPRPSSDEFRSVSAGGFHTCAVDTEFKMWCWGLNEHGQSDAPEGHFLSVGAGHHHTCGVRTDHSVECWGEDIHGQATPPDGSFTSVSGGLSATCGLKEDGAVVCWGREEGALMRVPEGQFVSISVFQSLGCGLRTDGSVTCWGGFSWAAIEPEGRFTSVGAGFGHACGIRPDGSVFCWGHDLYGQATPPGVVHRARSGIREGQPSEPATEPESPQLQIEIPRAVRADALGRSPEARSGRPPVRSSSTTTEAAFSAISAGYGHTCGLRTDGSPVCWGWTKRGQAEPPTHEAPVAISSGYDHTCGLRYDGSAVCWGSDAYGKATPPAGETFTAISSGDTHTCGLRPDGSAVCWGASSEGETAPPRGETFTAISSGDIHTCGLRRDGTAVCWGADYYGQATPPQAETFTDISSGGAHTCGLRTNGSAVCWGWDHNGQATAPARESLIAVSSGRLHTCGLRTDGSAVCWGWDDDGWAIPPTGIFTAISAGDYHTCGLRPGGSVSCWGSNFYGEATPPPGNSLVSISARQYHACALMPDGSPVCWGPDNYGEATPPDEERLAAISTGYNHTCGLRPDGTPVCWGHNDVDQSTPPAGATLVDISSGRGHTCGLRPDGSAVCWGENDGGEATPPAGATLTTISTGYRHTCGLRSGGSAVCWGRNNYGEAVPPTDEIFVDISSGNYHTCGLRADGSVACWGWGNDSRVTVPATDNFIAISSGGTHTCGLKPDGSVACWGLDDYGETIPPYGETFTAISSGDFHTCGLRSNGSAVCWGGSNTLVHGRGRR